MSKIISRDNYLNMIISRKKNGLIKFITGMRRCGKSYLLNEIFATYLINNGVQKDHIIKMAFDLFKNEKYRNADVFFEWVQKTNKDDGEYYFLLDKIQMLDKFVSILNSLANRKNFDIYVIGSNAKLLSKDIVTEFSGRGDEIKMYPLSFSEFISA